MARQRGMGPTQYDSLFWGTAAPLTPRIQGGDPDALGGWTEEGQGGGVDRYPGSGPETFMRDGTEYTRGYAPFHQGNVNEWLNPYLIRDEEFGDALPTSMVPKVRSEDSFLDKIAPMLGMGLFGLPLAAAGGGLGGLLKNVTGGGDLLTNFFGGQAANAASTAASDVFGLTGAASEGLFPWDPGAAQSVFGGAENLLEPVTRSVGDEWLQNVLNPAAEGGEGAFGGLGGEGVQTDFLDFLEEYPGGGEIGAPPGAPVDYSGIPDVPDFPSMGGPEGYGSVADVVRGAGAGAGAGAAAGGVPEWASSLAKALGLSPSVLGRIIGGLAGGAAQVRQGNQQVDTARAQQDITQPYRDRFGAMVAAPPGSYRRTDPQPLLDSAANTLGKGWSMRAGNPADSPRAIRSTERDLAELKFKIQEADYAAEEREKRLLAEAGGLTRANPDAPFTAINAGRDLQTRGATGALGTVLNSIFNPPQEKSQEELIAEILRRFPEIFGGGGRA